ncbi:proline-rich transmembrane protein 1-like [Rhineura floridana]|uniref:proline-rich transmembrane protein 1-like n=1 Tax=Rhineura floridana TaxID=261503 RepID=UPI002AC84FCE|nr:proline-rich transmembrane protein 1-like [Rhineura floridana]
MSDHEKLKDDAPYAPHPPPYSEKQPHRELDPTKPLVGPAPSLSNRQPIPVPSQYQHYGAVGAGSYQDPILQPPQITVIRRGPPTHEPDYLPYSIFTMLCCCLPLGIAALVYSIQTREANHNGDLVAAQRASRVARTLANTALGVGIICTIAYIIILACLYSHIKNQPPHN